MRLCPIMIIHSHHGWIVAKRSLQITIKPKIPPAVFPHIPPFFFGVFLSSWSFVSSQAQGGLRTERDFAPCLAPSISCIPTRHQYILSYVSLSLVITHHQTCAIKFPRQMLHLHTEDFWPTCPSQAKTCSLVLPPSPGPVFRPPALDPISGGHTCLGPKFRELGPITAAQIRSPSNPHGFSQGFLCCLPLLPFPLPSPSPMHTLGMPTKDRNGAPPTMHIILERTEDQGLATQNHCL